MERFSRRDLGKKAGLFIIGTFSLGSIIGCSTGSRPTYFQIQEDIIKQKGLYGDLPLVNLREPQDNQDSKTIGGGIVFTDGVYKGSTTGMIRFAWQTNEPTPTLVRSTLPESLVAFISSKQEVPSVEFIFDYPKPVTSLSPMDSLNPSDYLDPESPNNRGRVKLMIAKIKMNDTAYYEWAGIKR